MPGRKGRGHRSLAWFWQVLGLLVIACGGFAVAFLLTGDRGAIAIIEEHAKEGAGKAPREERSAPLPSTSIAERRNEDTSRELPGKSSVDQPDVHKPVTPTNNISASPRCVMPAPSECWEEIWHGSRTSPRIALTFDAGADSAPTLDILATLAGHGVHCTFFLTGKWIERNPSLVRRIAAEGHEIGNHTYSHKRLTQLSEKEIADELDRVEQLVRELTGQSTKPLARVPYGSRDKRTLQVLASLGYRSIYWDVDSWDSVKPGITSTEIRDRVLKKIQNGSIVLMHCGSRATADALGLLIDNLQARGYQPVTVGELISTS